ncbi:serine/threonine-protein kinase [Williamsia soli]|uniref:serine/threonine-protein kinase n=1 Tax=Williamsia soli TaxID=364929 RepID=UPI001A9DB683|nr:serine/threonine-protein kinase [Williamsia soli]
MPVPDILAARYRLRALLGQGGMGEVYDGWDERLQRPVAVKVLRPELASNPDIRLRFETEARTAATLNHPNVVAVHDSGEDRGIPFIVMERLPGPTLSDEISERTMSPQRVRTVLIDVLAAVSAAHAAGILHRDIKPGNVLFTAAGAVKVADFGIAKTAETTPTATGEVLGTVAYLSPERIAGRPATVSDDLYAVGVVGYEALAGRRPFGGDNILSLAQNILNRQPQPLSSIRPDVDPALIRVIEQAMADRPDARFTGADAMRSALMSSAPAVAQPLSATTPFTNTPASRSSGPAPLASSGTATATRILPKAAALVAVLTVVLVAVMAVLLFTRDDDGVPTPAPSSVQPSTSTVHPSSASVQPSTASVQPSAAPTSVETAPPPAPAPAEPNPGNGNTKEKKPKENNGNKD